MKKKTFYIVKAAVVAALYAVLTLLGAVFGLSFSGVQFRFSEALCVLPVFSHSSVVGLALGCIVSNLFSTVSPLDIVIGSAASLLSGLCTRSFGHVKIKGLPVLSMLFPVLFNGIFVGFELAIVSGEKAFWTVFLTNAVSVALGEAAVVFTLGTALYTLIQKNGHLKKLISD